MKKRALFLIPSLAALVLEILPYGAVCNFMNIEGEPWRITFSYFSLTPYGYANFGPFLTAVLTCVLIVLLGVYTLKGFKKLRSFAKVISCVATATSLWPLLLGISYFSVVGAFISFCLISELLILKYLE